VWTSSLHPDFRSQSFVRQQHLIENIHFVADATNNYLCVAPPALKDRAKFISSLRDDLSKAIHCRGFLTIICAICEICGSNRHAFGGG